MGISDLATSWMTDLSRFILEL